MNRICRSARSYCLVLVGMLAVSASTTSAAPTQPLRAGMIGCDTSHATAFTRLLNASTNDVDHLCGGVQVVAALPESSDDIASSRDRLGKFTEELRSLDVEMVDSIDQLLERVDVVMILSVDGRKHLEQARKVIEAGKPVYIDKPMAASLSDAVQIFELASKNNVPIFSCSGLRYTPGIRDASSNAELGGVVGCVAYSPSPYDATHPDLFWDGIHGIESLFTVMGPGCERVVRTHTEDTDVVTGVWRDGRVGTFRGLRSGKRDFGALVFGAKAIEHYAGFGGYQTLVAEIAQFFKTGKSPIAASETLEILAFMEAAEQSKLNKGAPVAVQPLLAAATLKMPYERDVRKFEAQDRQHPAEKGQVLFVGSSSIVLWDLEKSFGHTGALNRGYGGSQFPHQFLHFDRVVKPYTPRTIVLYCGDNDINSGRTPQQVFEDFKTYVQRVHREVSATTRIVYLPIKPSRKRWSLWEKMDTANQLIADYAETDDLVTYADIVTPMLADSAPGDPPPADLFADDGLHLSAKGYAIWTSVVNELVDMKPRPTSPEHSLGN